MKTERIGHNAYFRLRRPYNLLDKWVWGILFGNFLARIRINRNILWDTGCIFKKLFGSYQGKVIFYKGQILVDGRSLFSGEDFRECIICKKMFLHKPDEPGDFFCSNECAQDYFSKYLEMMKSLIKSKVEL